MTLVEQQPHSTEPSVLNRLDAAAGEFLERATLGLYQAESPEYRRWERSGMSLEPVQNGGVERLAGTDPVPVGQFGSGRLTDKLLRKLDKVEQEAQLQAIELARIAYLTREAQNRMSEAALAGFVRSVSDADIMDKLMQVSESLPDDAKARLYRMQERYLERIDAATEVGGAAILARLTEQTRGNGKSKFFDLFS